MSAVGVAIVGVILLVIAAITGLGLLWTLGIIALVIAAVLFVVELVGRRRV